MPNSQITTKTLFSESYNNETTFSTFVQLNRIRNPWNQSQQLYPYITALTHSIMHAEQKL